MEDNYHLDWRRRFLSTTRGQVISLLRTGPRTVNELAEAIGLTDNAVRTHLAAMERDGLVQQDGVRRALGKPAYVYRLTTEAECLFPKPYSAILGAVLARLREKLGPEVLEEMVREIGRETGEPARVQSPELRKRVEGLVAFLDSIGGAAEIEEHDDAFLVRGYSCPLSAVIPDHPEVCKLAEELAGAVVGTRVSECCSRGQTPQCTFRVSKNGTHAAAH